MLHHRTDSVAKRIEHIADRLECEHERQVNERNIDILELYSSYPQFRGEMCLISSDWPRYWLNQYEILKQEFAGEASVLNETD